MKGLNLSKFKKIHEDKDWADLIHTDGHKLRIAKAPLSSIQRKQLEHLEMHYAEGGAASPEETEAQTPAKSVPTPSAPLPGYPGDPSTTSPPPAQEPPPANITPAQAAAIPQVARPEVPTASTITGLKTQKAGEEALGQAQAAQAQSESKIYQNFVDQSKAQQNTQSDVIKKFQERDQQLFDAYKNQKIDPQAYWTGPNAHSKLAAGIGVLISGLGQALGGGSSNMALDDIHKGVNDEIARQSGAQEKNHNLWRMNREALGSTMAANMATQNQLLQGVKYQVMKAGADAGTPLALANSQIRGSQIQQQIDQNNFKLALLNPTSDNPDPASRVQFLVPPGEQKEVAKHLDEAKHTVRAYPGIIDAFMEAAKDARPLSGGVGGTSPSAFVPSLHTPGQTAFRARIGPTVQEAEGSVRQAVFDNVDKTMTPSFGDSDQAVYGNKLNSLIDYATGKTSASLPKAYGIDMTKFPATNLSRASVVDYIAKNYPDAIPYLNDTQAKNLPQTQSMTAQSRAPSAGGYERKIINGKAYMVPVQPTQTAGR